MTATKLFAGFVFYFYPPRPVSRLNGLRASASARHGATIEPTGPSPHTTHILVAKEVDFAKVVELKKGYTHCLVLSSEWCSQCIDKNMLLDTEPFEFRGDICTAKNSNGLKNERTESLASRCSIEPTNEPNAFTNITSGSTSEPNGSRELKRSTKEPNGSREPKRSSTDRFSESTKDLNRPTTDLKRSTTDLKRSTTDLNGPDHEPNGPEGPNAPNESVTESSSMFTSGLPIARESTSPKQVKRDTGMALVRANQPIVDILHDIMLTRQLEGDEFSARAYERALKALASAESPIVSEHDAASLAGMTPRMAALVKDIRGGSVTSMLTNPSRQKTETLQLFSTVYGVGPFSARRLYDKGLRTLDEIKPHLDRNGRVSIEHHADFIERMPRAEVAQHYEAVKALAALVDPSLEAECMGSYRRGRPDCGDIDIILTKRKANLRELQGLHRELLDRMFEKRLAVHTFTDGGDRWLGATQVVSKWRRMDILLVPWKELGAALIYYTGSDMFNRHLRLKAKRQGKHLNHNGLFEANRLLEAHDERRIFELLDEPWLEPTQRNI